MPQLRSPAVAQGRWPVLTRLVLASASPRRRALIGLVGRPTRLASADVDELAFVLDDPVLSALNIALAKAGAIPLAAEEIVVAADTVVIDPDGALLGKPADPAAATAMLRQFAGRGHDVVTALQLRAADGRTWAAAVSTRVEMRAYGEAEIAALRRAWRAVRQSGRLRRAGPGISPGRSPARLLPERGRTAGLCARRGPHDPRRRGGLSPAGPPPCAYCAAGAPLVEIGARC